jgi:lectin family protein
MLQHIPGKSSIGGAKGWARILSRLSWPGTPKQKRGGFRPVMEQLEGREAPGGLHFSHGFAGAAGLALNGSAAIVGTRLRLTDGGGDEAGSAFTTQRFKITKFHTKFRFQLTPGTDPTADGITFTIQNSGPTALGDAGGNLGYTGIPSSVAIKWDLFDNDGEGVNSTGVFVNGQAPFNGGIAPAKGSTNFNGTGIDLHSGHVFKVEISYHGKHNKLTVETIDTVTHAKAKQTYFVNIPATVGGTTAFVGFTGGTGALAAVQDIVTWRFHH